MVQALTCREGIVAYIISLGAYEVSVSKSLLYVPPPIDREYGFCSLKCLTDWAIANAKTP